MNEQKLSVQQRAILCWLWQETLACEERRQDIRAYIPPWKWRMRCGNWTPSKRASFSRALRRLRERGLIQQFCFHKDLAITDRGREIAKRLTTTHRVPLLTVSADSKALDVNAEHEANEEAA